MIHCRIRHGPATMAARDMEAPGAPIDGSDDDVALSRQDLPANAATLLIPHRLDGPGAIAVESGVVLGGCLCEPHCARP
jgi:hypothetical protein